MRDSAYKQGISMMSIQKKYTLNRHLLQPGSNGNTETVLKKDNKWQ